jgi:site-specific recombinase XerD
MQGSKMSKFIESVRSELRVRRYSLKTEKAYLGWIKRYIRFHNLAHPNSLQAHHIEEFLSHLANSKKVSAATQSQALYASYRRLYVPTSSA